MNTRQTLLYIFLLLNSALFGQNITPAKQDLGKVKEWNNPVLVFQYQNTSNTVQRFLPISYQANLEITVDKMELQPAERTEIRIRYFTEEFGPFEQSIPIYLSTLNYPVYIKIKGNIKSFHPDALVFCPPMGGSSTAQSSFEHIIAVRDADSKQVLTDYELSITAASKELQRRNYRTYSLALDLEKPDLFQIEVDKEEYYLAEQFIYIHRHLDTSWIELKPVEAPLVMIPIKDSTISYPLDEPADSSLFVAKPKPIKDTLPILNNPPDSTPVLVSKPDTSVFTEMGSLNPALFRENHILFVIDISASMDKAEKLPLLKYSMIQLLQVLRPEDKITIITYASSVEVLAEAVSIQQKDLLIERIMSLEAQGQSYGAEALDRAFALAKEHFIQEGNNEIILASDGVFNSPGLSKRSLYRKAWWKQRFNKIRLSTIGFGKSPYALDFMQRLASNGSGNYLRIPDERTAEEILVVNLMEHSRK